MQLFCVLRGSAHPELELSKVLFRVKDPTAELALDFDLVTEVAFL